MTTFNICIYIYWAVALFLYGTIYGVIFGDWNQSFTWRTVLRVSFWPLTALLGLLKLPWKWLVQLLDSHTMIPFYVNYWCGFYSNWSPEMLSHINEVLKTAQCSSEKVKRKWTKAVNLINKKNNYTA